MPLKQHQFYVYYEGATVYARAGDKERVVVDQFEDTGKLGEPDYYSGVQKAHDLVQSILNPESWDLSKKFAKPDSTAKKNIEWHHEDYQKLISPYSEATVRAAYLKAGVAL